MKLVACRYAVIQFAPFRETGEFANAGVVLVCPETGYFGYRLQTRRTRRITEFFDGLTRSTYLRAMKIMEEELQRVAGAAAACPATDCAPYLRQLFEGLVHPREALVRFAGPRGLMTANPAAELAEQFDHHVERTFATPEYVEKAMEKRIRHLLGTLELKAPFAPQRVGDDVFYAKFPLVQKHNDVLSKIIKPFRLDQDAPVDIYEHGDAWVKKIERLRKRKLLPKDVLFAVKTPPSADAIRYAACNEICTELWKLDVRTVAETADREIAEFAIG